MKAFFCTHAHEYNFEEEKTTNYHVSFTEGDGKK